MGIPLLAILLTTTAAPAIEIDFDTPAASDDLRDDLADASLLIGARDEGVDDPQELLAAARADYARLVGALYAEGRFGGTVNILVDGREASEIPPLGGLDRIDRIVVRIDPGPVYDFSRAEVDPLAPETELPEGFALGEPARTPLIESAASAGVEGWRGQGRAKADIGDEQIVADHDADTLAARIVIAPGPVVRFGDLRPQGYTRMRPDRIVEIAGLPTGEVFDPDELERAASRLRRTQVFRSVALVEDEQLAPGNVMGIEAQLDEEAPRRFGFGAELSSIDGLTLSAFWLHRNLFGGAERLRVDGELAQLGLEGGEDYSFATRFERPATFGADTDLYVLGEIERLNEDDFTSNTGTIGAGLTRIVTEDLSVEAGIAYRFSRVEDEAGERDYSLLTFPLGATLDKRDDTLNPANGYYVDADLTPFLGYQSADNGGRLTFDARGYRGFGEENRFIFAGRLQGGSILGADLEGVPNDYRFYSGGGGTVRGQDYQSLGVTLPSGVESGGASYLAVSTEARVGVTDNIGVVGFVDWGSVSEDSVPGSGDSHSGAGLGVRYYTPIGPIRLDAAVPVSGGGSGVSLYVGIGQAF
ncbi:outer membrane protein assembly factor [Mesobaculum littorinae]|uniref:Outer membrane protein assembly factor n=1 Tax=Mesobaculum littorinae TaxID=2486419 RepID=A0A438AHS3_9RHOB|nr:outer membrane protein assembly factor [Mesobaculum littorinae]